MFLNPSPQEKKTREIGITMLKRLDQDDSVSWSNVKSYAETEQKTWGRQALLMLS